MNKVILPGITIKMTPPSSNDDKPAAPQKRNLQYLQRLIKI